MKKRIFSRILAFVMAVSLLSTTAFAASFKDLQGAIDSEDTTGSFDGGSWNTTADQTKNITLTDNITYDNQKDKNTTTITITGNVTLDLNGNTITHADVWKNVSAITVTGENASLTLQDGKSGGTISGGKGLSSGVIVDKGASFTMEGGTITGFSSSGGSGVSVKEGSFKMTGGEITKNTKSGVLVSGANSSFIMDGGKISENTGSNGGGGVTVSENAVFTMNGGEISGNTAGNGNGGGGVKAASNATFNMTGGKIIQNTAKASGGGVEGYFANVNLTAGEGKEIIISENKSTGGHGGGIGFYTDNSQNTLTVDGVTLEENSTTGPAAMGGAMYISGSGAAVDIKNTTMRNNKTVSNVGNALRLTSREFNLTNCTIENENAPGQEISTAWGAKINFSETAVSGHSLIENGVLFSNNGFTLLLDENNNLTITDSNGKPVEAILDGNGKRIEAGKQNTEANQWGGYELELTIPFSAVPTTGEDEENPSDTDTTPGDATLVPDAVDTLTDTTTIEDEEVPLAGLVTLVELLEELRQYEGIEDVELPEDFQWLDHDYAQAIYWGLNEALVEDSEDDPLDPDEIVTVAILREVLENFVEYKGVDLTVTVDGEDDMIVMDLGERLVVFYGELEAAPEAKAA